MTPAQLLTAEEKSRRKKKRRQRPDNLGSPGFLFSGDAFVLDHVTAVGLITVFSFDGGDRDLVGLWC